MFHSDANTRKLGRFSLANCTLEEVSYNWRKSVRGRSLLTIQFLLELWPDSGPFKSVLWDNAVKDITVVYFGNKENWALLEFQVRCCHWPEGCSCKIQVWCCSWPDGYSSRIDQHGLNWKKQKSLHNGDCIQKYIPNNHAHLHIIDTTETHIHQHQNNRPPAPSSPPGGDDEIEPGDPAAGALQRDQQPEAPASGLRERERGPPWEDSPLGSPVGPR